MTHTQLRKLQPQATTNAENLQNGTNPGVLWANHPVQFCHYTIFLSSCNAQYHSPATPDLIFVKLRNRSFSGKKLRKKRVIRDI